MKTKTPRCIEDVELLAKAIGLAKTQDATLTFREWTKQLNLGKMTDLGPARRSTVRNFIAEQGGAPAPAKDVKIPYDPDTKYVVSRADVRKYSQEVCCGPRPAYPPGCGPNTPRFGRRA